MFGRGKMQPGILVELHGFCAVHPEDESESIELRNKIWYVTPCTSCMFRGIDLRRPTVAEANTNAPTFAKIFKEMVIFTDPAKPLPRTLKGTIMRKQALALYSDAIEELYVAIFDNDNCHEIQFRSQIQSSRGQCRGKGSKFSNIMVLR